MPSAVKLRRADTANSKTAARFQKKQAAVFLPLSAGSARITAEKNYRADIVSTTVTELNELIDHIDVYETQGTGKNKTQCLVIYYKFVGYLDIDPTQCHPDYTADIREGVAIEYVSCEPPDSLKELFSEGYNADDDSFEEVETEPA